MKKILSLLLLLILALALTVCMASCGDSEGEPSGGGDTADTRTLPCKVCENGEYVPSVESAATTFEEGVTVYTCGSCGDSYGETVAATGKMSILVIGDASSSTSLGYLDDVLISEGVSNVVIATANCNHQTGASVGDHWQNISTNKGAYTLSISTNGAAPTPTYRNTLADVLASATWDYIVIQQSIPEVGVAESYSELGNYLTFLREHKPDGAKILWNMGWAYNKDSSHSGFEKYGNDQSAMFSSIVSTLLTFVSNNDSIDGILPVGSAVQNLRQTFFDGKVSSNSGIALGTELGDYVTAVTWASEILGKPVSELSDAIGSTELNTYRDVIDPAIEYAFDDPTEIKAPPVRSFKILIFGNSYSNDAITYLTHIFQSAGYHEVVIGSISDGGCNINHHWWNVDDTLEDYHPGDKYAGMTGIEGTAGCYVRTNGVTKTASADTLKERYIEVISAVEWDYVSIQHGPDTVEKTETYSYLPNLLEFIEEHLITKDAKFVYHMVWKYNDNQANQAQRTEYQYENILNITHNIVLKNDQFENRVVPAATFRQNLVSSFLTDKDISRDYGHMGLTLGRYALGLLWYCYYTGGSVDDVTFVPTEDNVSKEDIAKYKAEYGHTHIEITEEDMIVVKEAIENALKTPYEVTQSAYPEKPTV